MRPLIRTGSLVHYETVAAEELSVGDIIVYSEGRRIVAHRLIETSMEPDGLRLRQKGDNELRGTWLSADALIGRAVALGRGERRRSLRADTHSRRLRALTRMSRLEADIFDAYLALRSRGRPVWLLKWPVIVAAAVAAPFRRAVLSFLLTAYPAKTRVDNARERRLLVDVYRTVLGRNAPRTDDSTAPVQWTSFMELAGTHGLGPAIANTPADRRPTAIPDDVVGTLKLIGYRAAVRHVASLAALARIHAAFTDSGIPYAVLKGPYLYADLYADLWPRDSEDVDILIPRAHIDNAIAALSGEGYTLKYGAALRALLRRIHFHHVLKGATEQTPPVELHWELVDGLNLYRVEADEVLERGRTFETGDTRFRVLSPGDQLLYLCLHAAKHGALNGNGLKRGCTPEWFCRHTTGNRLLWFADIELFLRRYAAELDWPALRARIQAWNIGEPVVTCLRVMDILLPSAEAQAAMEQLELQAHSKARTAAPVRPARLEQLDGLTCMHPLFRFRPVRLLDLGRLLFPCPAELRRYYRPHTKAALPWLYIAHPFRLLAKALR